MELSSAEFFSPPESLDASSGGHYRICMVISGYGFLIPAAGAAPVLLCPGASLLIRPGETPHLELLTEAKLLDFRFSAEPAALMRSNAPAFAEHNPLVISSEALEQAVRLGEEIIGERHGQDPAQ